MNNKGFFVLLFLFLIVATSGCVDLSSLQNQEFVGLLSSTNYSPNNNTINSTTSGDENVGETIIRFPHELSVHSGTSVINCTNKETVTVGASAIKNKENILPLNFTIFPIGLPLNALIIEYQTPTITREVEGGVPYIYLPPGSGATIRFKLDESRVGVTGDKTVMYYIFLNEPFYFSVLENEGSIIDKISYDVAPTINKIDNNTLSVTFQLPRTARQLVLAIDGVESCIPLEGASGLEIHDETNAYIIDVVSDTVVLACRLEGRGLAKFVGVVTFYSYLTKQNIQFQDCIGSTVYLSVEDILKPLKESSIELLKEVKGVFGLN